MKRRILSVLLVFCMVMTLLPTASMAANGGTPDASGSPAFSDIGETDWFYQPVSQAVEKGIFTGISGNQFDPGGAMSRAMFVTVVGRIAGIDPTLYVGNGGFSDVTTGAWYAPYVVWAAENGIVQGYDAGRFGTNDNVSREQMATILLRWLRFAGIKLDEAASKPAPKDIASASGWAEEAILALWYAGLLLGDEAGDVNPGKKATRAEGATFCVRVDNIVDAYYKEAGIPRPGSKSEKPTTVFYTITFESNGGSQIANQRLPSSTRLDSLPAPYQMGFIFVGWYYDKELTQPVAITDRLEKSLTLYAKYQEAGEVESSGSPYFITKADVETGFTVIVNSTDTTLAAEAVKGLITAKNISSNQTGDVQVTGEGGSYTVSGPDNAFQAGATYKITLNDERLTFAEQESSIREYNFTVKRDDEVMGLVLSDDIKYIPASEVGKVTENGVQVASMDVALLTVGVDGTAVAEATTGSFTYSGSESLSVGNTVAIYEGMSPDDRTTDASGNGKNDSISYVVVTGANGNTYSYKSAEVEDVVFTPDMLPVPANADTDNDAGNNSITVPKAVLTYTDDVYAKLKLDSQTTIDVGDYIAFYTGEFGKDNAADVSYALITSVQLLDGSYTIGYETVTEDEVLTAMDIYDTDDISGDALLEGVDRDELERSIALQAEESGFAEEAGAYLAAMALETDAFTELSSDYQLTGVSLMDADGAAVSPAAMRSLAAGSRIEITDRRVNASIGTKLVHFDGLSGVRAVLTVGIEVTIHAADGADIVMNLTGTFEQEVRVSINVSGGIVWAWAWIFPYIDDYQAAVSADLYDFTGIGVKATITTNGGEPEDISSQLQDLMERGGDSSVSASLQEKYKQMLETESDWVDLFTQNIFTQRFNVALIFTVELTVDFVVSANMNISLGCDFWYENAKRYTYSIHLFAGQVTSDTINLVDEHYVFEFYVMGTLGLRAGIRAEISLSLITKSVAYVAVTAEAGAYVKLWGYFYYKFEHSASQGKTSGASGAMLLEMGAYLEITFTASAIGGRFSYSPTLYENEWPLWTAGNEQNINGFAYLQSAAPEVRLKNFYTTYILPDSVFEMGGMNLKTGDPIKKVYDDSDQNFIIEMTNSAFSYNPISNTITVNPGDQPRQDGAMIITWKGQSLAFSSSPVQRTIPLHWDNLRDGYYIVFNTNGGSAMNMLSRAYGASVTPPADPVRQGYVFGGWYTDAELTIPYAFPATMPNVDTLVYAKWTKATNIAYTVEHYKQELNGSYALDAADVLRNGTTGESKATTPKTYEGFDTPATQTISAIAADGSSVIRYYYPRTSYTVTFSSGVSGIDGVVSSFKYGASITAPSFASAGYAFNGWIGGLPETMPAHNLTLTASWIPRSDTAYRVEHYVQRADGVSYELQPVVNLTGKTGETLTLAALKDDALLVPGGISYSRATVSGQEVTSAEIQFDGSLVIKLYYTRDNHRLTWNFNGGATEDRYTTNGIYESGITAPANVSRMGYDFAGWYADSDCTVPIPTVIPTEDIAFYAKWTARSDTPYTVEYYQQNANDDGYTLVTGDTKHLTGTTDTDSGSYADEDKYEYFTLNADADGYVASGSIEADGSLVLKLYYDRNSYDLSYDVDGEPYEETTAYRYGQTVTHPQSPTKLGYNFVGWLLDGSDFNGIMPGGEDITLTAKWGAETDFPYSVRYYQQRLGSDEYELVETVGKVGVFDTTVTVEPERTYVGFTTPEPQELTISEGGMVVEFKYARNSYNLAWNFDGGSDTGAYTQGSTEYAASITRPSNPKKTGYTFAGWNAEIPSSMPDHDLTFTAQWTINKYTISFNSNGGSEVQAITQDYNTTVGAPTAPTRTGYDFAGWYSDSGLTTAYEFTAMPAQNSTLYAKWKAVEYVVTYNLDGGTAAVKLKTPYTIEDSFTLPDLTKTGYTFAGWCTNPSLSDPQKSVRIAGETGAKEFWAKWTVNKYTIQFVSNGGTSVSSITADYGAAVSKPKDPTKTGYTFAGWYSNSGLTTAYNFTTMPAQNITLYAKWNTVSYTISYNLNGGSASNLPGSYTVTSATINLPNPTRDGYTFAGWSPNGTIPTGSTGNKTFTASWTLIKHTVNFVRSGDGVEGSAPADVVYSVEADGVTLPKNTFTKTGYHFTGWNTKADGSGTTYQPGSKAGDIANIGSAATLSLYPVWEANTYTVHLWWRSGRTDLPENISATYDQKIDVSKYAGLTGFNVIHPDGKNPNPTDQIGVTNLTDQNNATVTVMPVWESKGTGTSNDPILIYSREHMEMIDRNHIDKSFKMMADITFGVTSDRERADSIWAVYTATGGADYCYTGTLDGNGHKLIDMQPNGGYRGLFRDLGNNATVKNLTFVNTRQTNVDSTGAITPNIKGTNVTISNVTVESCTFSRTSKYKSLGGLVGVVSEGASLTISNCTIKSANFSTVEDSGNGGGIGAFVGRVAGTLTLKNNTNSSGYSDCGVTDSSGKVNR